MSIEDLFSSFAVTKKTTELGSFGAHFLYTAAWPIKTRRGREREREDEERKKCIRLLPPSPLPTPSSPPHPLKHMLFTLLNVLFKVFLRSVTSIGLDNMTSSGHQGRPSLYHDWRFSIGWYSYIGHMVLTGSTYQRHQGYWNRSKLAHIACIVLHIVLLLINLEPLMHSSADLKIEKDTFSSLFVAFPFLYEYQ